MPRGVLNFVVTSNHVHLLVKDTGAGVIAQSMQLAAGRTAQEFNRRRARNGAFWEDRYHATAVDADEHLHRCLTYIDLNMVRAGVVAHPSAWPHGGYAEIQQPRPRYVLIDLAELSVLCGFATVAVEDAGGGTCTLREPESSYSADFVAEMCRIRPKIGPNSKQIPVTAIS